MKLIREIARAFGAACSVVLLSGWFAFAVIQNSAPNGPFLGDGNVNLYSLLNAITQDNQMGFQSVSTVSQTLTQAACTQLNTTFPMVNVISGASAGTGSLCLPTATAGREFYIGNATGQTLDLFGSATTAVSGTQDTINGTAGTSAYTGLTNGKNSNCFAPAAGVWFCTSGS
jgi:hypothetical protein